MSVVDGRLALVGTFVELAGLEVVSAGGFLSLETIEIPPLGDVPLANPFSPATGVIVINTPQQIAIGVLGANNRINTAGTTITSILYAGDPEHAAADLTVRYGVGDREPEMLPVGEGG